LSKKRRSKGEQEEEEEEEQEEEKEKEKEKEEEQEEEEEKEEEDEEKVQTRNRTHLPKTPHFNNSKPSWNLLESFFFPFWEGDLPCPFPVIQFRNNLTFSKG